MELLFTKMKNVCRVGFGRGGEVGRGNQGFDLGCVKFEMPIRHPSRDVEWNDCVMRLGFRGEA